MNHFDAGAAVDLRKISTVETQDYQPSNKNKRVVAFILDLVFVAVIQQVFMAVAVSTADPIQLTLITYGFSFVMMGAYWTFLTYKFGGTPGKMIMGLRVIHEDKTTKLSFGRLLFRETIGRGCSTLPLFLGYLWISWDKERRTFHDMIARTRVIDYKK